MPEWELYLKGEEHCAMRLLLNPVHKGSRVIKEGPEAGELFISLRIFKKRVEETPDCLGQLSILVFTIPCKSCLSYRQCPDKNTEESRQ